MKFWKILARLPAQIIIGTVRSYQWMISPWLGQNCRFEPSCSQYFIGPSKNMEPYEAACEACGGLPAATLFTPAATIPLDPKPL